MTFWLFLSLPAGRPLLLMLAGIVATLVRTLLGCCLCLAIPFLMLTVVVRRLRPFRFGLTSIRGSLLRFRFSGLFLQALRISSLSVFCLRSVSLNIARVARDGRGGLRSLGLRHCWFQRRALRAPGRDHLWRQSSHGAAARHRRSRARRRVLLLSNVFLRGLLVLVGAAVVLILVALVLTGLLSAWPDRFRGNFLRRPWICCFPWRGTSARLRRGCAACSFLLRGRCTCRARPLLLRGRCTCRTSPLFGMALRFPTVFARTTILPFLLFPLMLSCLLVVVLLLILFLLVLLVLLFVLAFALRPLLL
mmetsp:Transcript_99828/g.281840  ORF Transcript_99828/g.281840 Transcript_99828/m.281840 type:complete len:306 (-) Transcript_99828:921-1838(-)